MDALCIYISSEDSSGHINICSECNEYINISATSDDFIIISSNLYEGIIISSEDCTGHISIDSDFTLGMEIYSSYVCIIDKSGYLFIIPDQITITPVFQHPEIEVVSNIDWEIVEQE